MVVPYYMTRIDRFQTACKYDIHYEHVIHHKTLANDDLLVIQHICYHKG